MISLFTSLKQCGYGAQASAHHDPAKTQPGKAEEPLLLSCQPCPACSRGRWLTTTCWASSSCPGTQSHSWGQILAEPECTWVQSQHQGGQGGTRLCTHSRTGSVLCCGAAHRHASSFVQHSSIKPEVLVKELDQSQHKNIEFNVSGSPAYFSKPLRTPTRAREAPLLCHKSSVYKDI